MSVSRVARCPPAWQNTGGHTCVIVTTSFGDAVDGETALGARLVRPDLADAFRCDDGDALSLLEAREEATHRMRCPVHRLCDLGDRCALGAAEHRQHLGFLLVLALRG